MRFQDFSTHFLDEVLSQDVVHIDDLPFLENIQVILDILSSCVNLLTLLSHIDNTSFFFLFFFLMGFDKRIM
jgi:hypothetical protein